MAIKIIDMASYGLTVNYPSSAVMTMADHINFMLERNEKNIYLDMPIIEDIKHLYPDEMNIGYKAL